MAFMLHSASVRNLQFPVDKKEYQMGLLQSFFVCTRKGLLIYSCITQERALSLTKFWILDSLFPKATLFSQLHTNGVLSHCAIFCFQANSHSPCLFWEPPNNAAELCKSINLCICQSDPYDLNQRGMKFATCNLWEVNCNMLVRRKKCLFWYFLQFPRGLAPHYDDCQKCVWRCGGTGGGSDIKFLSMTDRLLGKLCMRRWSAQDK